MERDRVAAGRGGQQEIRQDGREGWWDGGRDGGGEDRGRYTVTGS